MQNRRTALTQLAAGVSATCCGLISCTHLRPETRSSLDLSRLHDDLKLLDRSPDSTDGVPVFLVCENSIQHKNAAFPNSQGAKLAANFRKIAAVYSEAKANASATDIPKLVELLALRDFGSPKQP